MKSIIVNGMTLYYAFRLKFYDNFPTETWTVFFDTEKVLRRKHWWSLKKTMEYNNTPIFELAFNIETNTRISKDELKQILEGHVNKFQAEQRAEQKRKAELSKGEIV